MILDRFIFILMNLVRKPVRERIKDSSSKSRSTVN